MLARPGVIKIWAIASAIEHALLPGELHLVQLRTLDAGRDLGSRTTGDSDEIAVIYLFTAVTTIFAEI